MTAWKPIQYAPKGVSVLLRMRGPGIKVYVGRQRYGQMGEPNPDAFEWRCDSSGRYGNPTEFALIPD